MAADRIIYALQNVAIDGLQNGDYTFMKGIQSVSMSTNFNLEQVFQFGQLNIYENTEGVPDVEMTLSKALDGSALMYTTATSGNNVGLVTASDRQFNTVLGIWDESAFNNATGEPTHMVMLSGCTVGSIGYNFSVDGPFTEDMTIQANNKIWAGSCARYGLSLESWPTAYTGDTPDAAGGIQNRRSFDKANCLIPSNIPEGKTRIQSISVSCDFGLEPLSELGSYTPYARKASFPIEVTSDIEVISTGGDGISATESGCATGALTQCDVVSNLTDEAILIRTCDGTSIDLGNKNKLSSVQYGGGDTAGGNSTVTYSFSNFNDLLVSGSGTFARNA